MIEKVYERTGIKEEKNKKVSKYETFKKQNHEQQIEAEIKRGIYKGNCKELYDLNLMSFEKEYEKVKLLLKAYLDSLVTFDGNIQSLIKGYKDYFDKYGINMTPLGLREFRNGIEKTILIAKKSYLESLKEDSGLVIDKNREDTLLNFCIQYLTNLEEKDVELSILTNLWNFLDEAGISFTGFNDFKLIKERVRTIYKELKED